MAERPEFEPTGMPVRTLLTIAGIGLVCLAVSLAAMMGLYRLWANGPQVRVTPQSIATASAPALDTYLFRQKLPAAKPDPAAAEAQGYRWRDAAHTRVDVPIDRAMAMVAARGAQAFDPPPGTSPTDAALNNAARP